MKPPIYKRLTLEDFRDGPAWLGRLFQVLNDFMQQTSAVLTNNVAFGENILARSFTATLNTPADYATGGFAPIRFSWPGSTFPNAVLITNVSRLDGAVFTGSVGTPTWSFNNGVQVNYVPGLAPSTSYSITFLVV